MSWTRLRTFQIVSKMTLINQVTNVPPFDDPHYTYLSICAPNNNVSIASGTKCVAVRLHGRPACTFKTPHLLADVYVGTTFTRVYLITIQHI